jgi:hypothetical protein
MLPQLTRVMRSIAIAVLLLLAVAVSSALAAHAIDPATAHAAGRSHAVKHKKAHKPSHKRSHKPTRKKKSAKTKAPKVLQADIATSTTLLGVTAVEANRDALAAGQAEAFLLQAGFSGVGGAAHVYISTGNAAKSVAIGIYSDVNGQPGSLLSTGSAPASAAGTWSTVSIGNVNLVAGTSYWLAILGTGGTLDYRDRASGSCPAETSAQTTLGVLPSTWKTQRAYWTCPASVYVTAAEAPPVEPPPVETPPVERPPAPAPVNTALPTIAGSAMQGQTLTASRGTWSGSPTAYAYQWQDCDALGESCWVIAGATSSSYTLTAGDLSSTVRVLVTASNAGGGTAASSAATATVLALPPVAPANTVLPVVSGSALEGQTLSASTGTWSGSPTSYAYQWQDCNSSGAHCVNVNGAVASSYELVAADVGHTVRTVVTASNAGGATAASSAASATVATPPPAAPSNTALPSIGGLAEEGQTLSVSTGTWSGSPTSYAYQWERCNSAGEACANVSGATVATYKLAAVDVGHTLRVVVTAGNAGGSTPASSLATATVEAIPAPGAPTNTVLPAVSGSAAEGQTLSASTGTWSGSPTSYAYQWQDCNSSGAGCANVSGATSAAYKLAASDVGHTLRAVVTASNAGGSTKASSAATGTVVPLAPLNTVLPAVSGSAIEAQTLSASTGTWSGSPTSYAYKWEDCNSAGEACISVAGATSSTYKLSASDVGHTLRAVVTASNVGGSTPATSAASGAVVPVAPSNTVLPSVSGAAVEGQTLSASTGTWSGSPTSYTYQWERCNSAGEACANVSGATGSTYKLVAGDVGRRLRVAVTASNAGGAASATSAATVAIEAAPSAPANTVLPALSGTTVEGQTLSVSTGTWSGSPTSYAYKWEDCNSAGEACASIKGATSSTYKLAASDVGYALRAVVTATNSVGSSAATASASAVVAKQEEEEACTYTIPHTESAANVAKKIVQATNGSTVCLEAGTFASGISISKATHTSMVTVRPVAGAAVTVPGLTVANSSYLRFKGLKLTEGIDFADGSGAAGNHYEVLESEFLEPKRGVELDDDTTPIKQVKIERNFMHKVVMANTTETGGKCTAPPAGEGTDIGIYGAEGVTVKNNTFDEVDWHYIQGGSEGPEGVTVEHNIFMGHILLNCSHLNFWQVYEGGTNDVLRDNVMIGEGTGSKGGTSEEAATDGLEFERGGSKSNECGPDQMTDTAVENNLMIDAGDSFAIEEFSLAGTITAHNTVVGSEYGIGMNTITSTTGLSCGPYTEYAKITNNIDVKNGDGVNDITAERCEGECVYNENVTEDATARKAFSKQLEAPLFPTAMSYVEKWTPTWTSTSWPIFKEVNEEGKHFPTTPTGFYVPSSANVKAIHAGYEGTVGIESAGEAAQAPQDMVRPSISGPDEAGQTLVGSPGSWQPSSTSYRYQWQACNGSGESCSNIAGATASDYTPSSENVGHAMRLMVTGSDEVGETAEGSAVTSAISEAEEAHTKENCFAHPGECGYPDPAYKCKVTCVGIEEGVTLTEHVGSITVTKEGEKIEDKSIKGEVIIEAKNVTLKNDRIANAGDCGNIKKCESQDVKVGVYPKEAEVTGTVLSHLELTKEGVEGLGEAVRNLAGPSTKGEYLYSYGVDSLWFRGGEVTSSYSMIELGFSEDHLENIDLQEEGKLVLKHDVLLNPENQTAAVATFCTGANNNIGAVTIEDNLLAGGGYTIYGGTSHSGEGCKVKGPFVIKDNRFSSAYFANGGEHGILTALEAPVTTVSGNYWDSNLKPAES